MRNVVKKSLIITVITTLSLLSIGSLLLVGGALIWGDQINFDSLFSVSSTQSSTIQDKKIVSEESVVTDVVSQVSDSVVSITVEQVAFDPYNGPQKTDNNIGTGFFINEEGLVVTNQHVVYDRNAKYFVTTRGNDVYEVTDVFRDEVNDIALVKIDSEGNTFTPLELGDSDSLQIGQIAIAIGTPLGNYPGTVTTGIVSGLGRSLTAGSSFWGEEKSYESVIQTDAAINPGNSGGPLLNSSAQVIGINFATTSGADNISFAIPVNLLKDRLEAFEASGGKFVKPYLGVSYQNIDAIDSFRFGVPMGVFVETLEENGPAEKGGVKSGDIITEISGKDTGKGLENVLLTFSPNDEVSLKIWRKTGETYREGEYVEISVILGETEQ